MSFRLKDVCWESGGRMIVDGVSLDVAPGETLGLLGPNGSGKSSLLRLICRLRQVTSGVITLGDEKDSEIDINRLSRRAMARRMALVEQQASTEAEVTLLDVVRLGRTPHLGPLSPWAAADDQAIANALRQVGLEAKCWQPWHTLSGGERQRAHLARALAQEPRELLLDEPTNHLDIQHQIDILALVSRLPITSIIALHDLNLAAMFCDRLVVLQAGRVVAGGTPQQVMTPALLRDVFGVTAHVEVSPYHGRPHIHFAMSRGQDD
jgi:iron complex transport system ATP-binding protein